MKALRTLALLYVLIDFIILLNWLIYKRKVLWLTMNAFPLMRAKNVFGWLILLHYKVHWVDSLLNRVFKQTWRSLNIPLAFYYINSSSRLALKSRMHQRAIFWWIMFSAFRSWRLEVLLVLDDFVWRAVFTVRLQLSRLQDFSRLSISVLVFQARCAQRPIRRRFEKVYINVLC